ncbi:RDD family protein [Salegentibacter sp. F188]|uniref:RDD family protein n=1 Tax=Autumnicola patrickiae TaxID=3075591 RepID=A0ABU3DZI7_9FLAO|nr:RDD family protein [Salegentibacter sp. F188]MDT0689053.1 RDD family protein [Salegentibacter sp. F188]
MDNFQIETAQNISIKQNVAGIGERIVAYIVDSFILILYAIITGLIISGTDLDSGGTWMYYLVLGLPVFLYYLLWETFWNGQTPGKAAMQLRVVKEDGSRPVFSNYLIRWLLRFIDITLTSGAVAVVMILLNGKGQRLGDLAAKTTVISEKQRMGIENTLAVDLPENYTPKYSQVTVLNDADIQEIKEIYRKAKINGNHNVILSLAAKVSELLDLEYQERPMDFISRVISDYNYYTQQ